MFLVGVDAFSKWPEVRVTTSTTAAATMDVLREWFAQHGIPNRWSLIMVRSSLRRPLRILQNRMASSMCEVLHTTPPNGLAERFVQSLKQSLKATVNDDCTLVQRLSSHLLAYHTTPHVTTGVPPCKLLMLRELRTQFSLLQLVTEKTVVDKQYQQKSAFDRRA